MRAFVRLRRMLASNEDLARKLAALEKKYDAQFKVVFDAIGELMAPGPQETKDWVSGKGTSSAVRKSVEPSFRRFENSRNVEVTPGTRTNTICPDHRITNTITSHEHGSFPLLVHGQFSIPSLFTLYTSHAKNPCQRRAISLKFRHNLFEGGGYRRRGEADHEQRVPTLSLILLPSYFLGARPGHGSLSCLASGFDHSSLL
jgi:hypothetical protein